MKGNRKKKTNLPLTPPKNKKRTTLTLNKNELINKHKLIFNKIYLYIV